MKNGPKMVQNGLKWVKSEGKFANLDQNGKGKIDSGGRFDAVGGDVDACNLGSTAGGGDETRQHPHSGGFAGSIGAEKGHHLPTIDGEGNIRDGGEVPEMLGQAFSLDHCLGHGTLHSQIIR